MIVALYVHLNTLCIRHVWTTIINFLYVRVNHHPCHWCRDADVKKKVYFLKSKDLCLGTSKVQKVYEKVTMGNKRVGSSQVLLIACSWLTDHEQVCARKVIQVCFNTISKKKTKSNDLRGATSAANHSAVGKTIHKSKTFKTVANQSQQIHPSFGLCKAQKLQGESLFSKKQHGRTARGNDLDTTTEPATFKSPSWLWTLLYTEVL